MLALVTEAKIEVISVVLELHYILYIWYSTQFVPHTIEALINSNNEINITQPSFTKKLSLCIQKTNIDTQNIDGNKLETFAMIITVFLFDNKDRKSRFFEKTILLAEISINIAFEILFLTLSNIQINFND